MTQDTRAIASTQRCCHYVEISSKKTSSYITIALGAIVLVSGIFLILAAHNVLPNGVNAISSLKMGSYVLSYAIAIAGSFVAGYGLRQLLFQKGLNNSVLSVEPQDDVEDGVDEGNEWKKHIKKAAKEDSIVGANGWKRGIGKNEVEQPFEAFANSEVMRTNASRNLLKIVIIDQGISNEEQEILQIVSDYLSVVHGVTVTLTTNYTLTDIDRRGNQYAVEPNLSKLRENLPETTFVLGFTSKDLYSYECRDSVNFIFGVGRWQYAAGLFSTCRFSDGSLEKTLIRLMRLASHEFGHMRGLAHCIKYACCMQGVNSMNEADKVPLTFCAQDMAKICHLNQWNLKEGYQRQLDFFENFEEKYRKKTDFSAEMERLKKKTNALMATPSN